MPCISWFAVLASATNSVAVHIGLSTGCWHYCSVFADCCIAVPVGVPAVELSIANTSLLVNWTALPPEKARGRISRYQVLLRRAPTTDQPGTAEPVIATVADVMQHVIDGMALTF